MIDQRISESIAETAVHEQRHKSVLMEINLLFSKQPVIGDSTALKMRESR